MLAASLTTRRHAPRHRGLRALALLSALVASLAIAGGAAQELHRSTAHAALSQDAQLVDIGGRDLRLLCTGRGERTYVLEAGATGFAETWTWVQGALDDTARVCSYDRAGMGLSDPAPGGFDPARVATDLHAALAEVGESGPFVLVGHSLGGLLIRDFADRFPQEVEAVVLVDSSHEDQLSVMPEDAAEMTRSFPDTLRLLAGLSATGVLNLWNPIEAGAAGLEGEALDRARLFAGDRLHLSASADEMARWDEISARARAADLPTDLPLLAVTAGAAVEGQPRFSDAFAALHRGLAGRSTAGEHHVALTADHFSILMDRTEGERLAALIAGFADRRLD